MTVGGQATSFSSSQNVGWIGYLSDSANGTTITIILARETGGGAESVIVSSPMDVANPQDNEFSHTPDTVLSSEGVGTYTIRYVRPSDGKTLAEGTVTITP